MGIDKMNDVEARIRFRTTPRLDHVVWPWHIVVCVLVLSTVLPHERPTANATSLPLSSSHILCSVLCLAYMTRLEVLLG